MNSFSEFRMKWVMLVILVVASAGHAQIPATQPMGMPATRPVKTQAELEADFAAMLSNATLDGSFTSTGTGRDPTRLSSDKYTLGTVNKLAGKIWLIRARIGYGNNEMLIPLPLPVEWAGDTPVIVVDNMTIPGMGTFNARVMFFNDHYSGYWSHGERGGILFGVVRRAPAGQ
jgi:hypothetical protein